jgi:hypothetical protein
MGSLMGTSSCWRILRDSRAFSTASGSIVGIDVGIIGFISSVTTTGVGGVTSTCDVSVQDKKAFPEKIRIKQPPRQHTDRIRRMVIIIGRVEDLVFIFLSC